MLVLYLCNGKNPNCSRTGCYFSFNGPERGPCKRTTVPAYAKNGPCDNPRKHPERFEAVEVGKGHKMLIERDEEKE